MTTPTLNPRRSAPLLFAAAALAAAIPSALHASTTISTWNGAVSANWSNPANWSPSSAYPSNGNGGTAEFNVNINPVTSPSNAPVLDVTATIDNLNLRTNATLSINAASQLNIDDSTLTNAGTLTILGDPTNSIATLNADSQIDLTGGGTIVLTNATFSRITGSWFNVNNTITGAGSINSPSFINQGTITAAGGTLTLSGSIDNSNGCVTVTADGTLSVQTTLLGGNLSTQSGSTVSGTFQDVTSTGSLSIRTVAPFVVSDVFTNTGNVTILGDPVNSVAQFNSAGNVTLNGGGTIFLTNATFSRIGGSGTWTNVDNTIRGQGTISAPLINQSTIIAEGGTLNVNASLDNAAGSVQVAADGTLNLAATLIGGTLNTQPGSTVTGTLQNVTSTGCLTVRTAGPVTISGTFTNSGNVTILGDPVNSVAQLLASGNVTLNGGGTVFLTDATFSRIGGSGTWTNVDNTIRGQGTISTPLINQNSIIAEHGAININVSLDNTAGTFTVAADGTLNASAPLIGGTLSTQSTSTVTGTLQNVTSTGALTVRTTAPVTISSNFTNSGNVTILGDPTNSVAQLVASGNVTLNGGGTIFLTNATFSRLGGSGCFTNVDNTIRGQGTISTTLINQHAIIAEHGAININIPLDNTAGTVTVASDGTLNASAPLFGGTLISQASTSVITGTLQDLTTTGPITVQPGGTPLVLAGNITNHGNITILGDPTNSIAQLQINSNVTLTGGGSILLTNPIYSRITGGGNITNINNTISGTGVIGLSSLTSSGPITPIGGNLTINAPVSVTNTSLGGSGFLLINDPLNINSSVSLLGNVQSGVLTLAGTANNWTANLNLTTAKLIVEDSSANRTADVALLKNAVIYGHTHAAGITSSTIPANKVLAISDNAIGRITTFEGSIPVDTNSILITVAYKGDANLDGVVDIQDLTTVANHWQQSVTDWSQGDFDGNNLVDIQDLTAVANNWQAGIPTGGGSSQSFSDAFSQLLQLSPQSAALSPSSPAPEPASLAFLALNGGVLATRRRRTR